MNQVEPHLLIAAKELAVSELTKLLEKPEGSDYGHTGVCCFLNSRLRNADTHYEARHIIEDWVEEEAEKFAHVGPDGIKRAWVDFPTHILTRTRRRFIQHLLDHIDEIK